MATSPSAEPPAGVADGPPAEPSARPARPARPTGVAGGANAPPAEGATLPPFGFVTVHREPLAGGIGHEAAWLATAAALGRASAHLWCAPTGLVVPRRYTSLPGWPAALAEAADGRHGELQVRSSGGGLVPQGPGVWNLSLAWPAPSATPSGTDAVYQGLCDALAGAFARLGLACAAQPVEGSFCDGRYNLAVHGAKLVGTAQAWRRVAGVPMVLAHAVIVVRADPAELTARANAFEAALGSGTRYRAEAITSVALAAAATPARGPESPAAGRGIIGHDHGTEHGLPSGREIEARTLTVLAEQFARVVPPRVHVSSPQEVSHGAA